jgi:ribose transport system ATP-binding protein
MSDAPPHPPPTGAGRDPDAVLEGISLSKSFGGAVALDNASFTATTHEVHALVGENGAGKSTLIKLLGGRLQPDSGTIRVRGRAVRLSSPHDAHFLGVRTVFQELMLFPGMTVAENLLLGREPRRAGVISHRRLGRRADEVLCAMGIHHIDPLALVEDISLAQQQMVEIVRALSQEPGILLLDEPTSSLVDHEVAWLFERIRELRARGGCIVFTSHRWHEVRSIADRITVFRNGHTVGTFAELDEREAVTLMTGRRLDVLFPPRPPAPTGRALLEVQELSGPRLNRVTLSLRCGEILGIGGLAGQGHRELFLTLFGALRPSSGRIVLDGRSVRVRGPREAKDNRARMALVPEDRKAEGLLLSMSVRDNLTLSILDRVSRLGVLRWRAETRAAQQMVRRLAVRTASMAHPVSALSGGNQQKVLLGRWLLTDPQVLLFYDVTRGVDVATKHEVYQLMSRLTGEGRAILFYSSDADELAALAHRVLVMRDGRVAAELTPPSLSAEQVVASAIHEPVTT